MADVANTLLPVYLAVGDDALKRETVADRLVKRVSRLGDLSFNSDTFEGENAKGADIVSACNTMPFASAVRLVTVRNVDKLRKADTEALAQYLASPNETTVLALYGASLNKGLKLYKAIAGFGKKAIIDCASVRKRDLPSLVASMAKSHGIMMTQGAAAALIDLVGEDTVQIDAELKKIALAHTGSDSVNEGEVTLMVSRTAEVKPWEFVNAFSSRNLPRCLYCRQNMKSTTSYALMARCATRLRELITAKAFASRGEQSRLASVLNLKDWQVRNFSGWSHLFTERELVEALRQARDTERAMKSGADPDAAFDAWYIRTIVR